MDAPTPADDGIDPARATTRRLAEALRAVAAAVVDRDLSQPAAADLLAAVERLQPGAAGPHRLRYYECPELEAAKSAFVDFSPISGRSHPLAVPMDIEPVTDERGAPAVRARLRVGLLHEGPPHGVHGGVIAAIFDELLGHAQMVHPVRALTATLTVRYRAVTPLDEDLELFAQVAHTSGRRWAGRATCRAGDVLTAEAEALFVGVDIDAIATR